MDDLVTQNFDVIKFSLTLKQLVTNIMLFQLNKLKEIYPNGAGKEVKSIGGLSSLHYNIYILYTLYCLPSIAAK
jgi:hypothetical protein